MSRGYLVDSPAVVHPSIIVSAGPHLTEEFKAKYQITHVINCAFDKDSPEWFRNRYPNQYACINAEDDINGNILIWYPKFRDTLNSFLKDPTCRRVFVHCQCGINRSVFLALAYACDIFKCDYQTLYKSILRQRPCAMTNPTYDKQIKLFCSKKSD